MQLKVAGRRLKKTEESCVLVCVGVCLCFVPSFLLDVLCSLFSISSLGSFWAI